MSSERPYELVLYGATGFTGGLIARYLARRLDERVGEARVRWALAGRNLSKLSKLRRELERDDARLAELGLIEADSADEDSLRAMARQARVVMTTVGPYARYGEPLVAACVAEGTDYLDLTGEPPWWHEMIERYHEEAARKQVMIIPCCGYDSIPYDLGAMLVCEQLPRDQPVRVDAYAYAKGGVSGGTWASALGVMGSLRDNRAAAKGRGGSGSGESKAEGKAKIHYEKRIGRWGVYAPMIDAMVVRRSARLRPEAYPAQLSFSEYMSPKRLVGVAGLLGFVGATAALAQFDTTRELLEGLRPSGSGPSAEQRAKHWFRVELIGRGGGREVRAHVSGGDPGYDETAKMMSEAAITLLEDRDQLPLQGGVLTPASALGQGLVDRLRAAGMELSID